jgi:polyhydroxybutyrate depolymerase
VNDGTQVRQTRYTGCRENTEVVYDAIAGAGHIWPGGPQYLPVRAIGKTTQNLDGSATIWAFFATHSKQ